MLEFKKGNDYFQYFDYSEFVEFCSTNERATSNDYSESGDRDFTGTDSYEEAEKLAKNGWVSGIDQLDQESDLKVEGCVNISNNVIGSYVDIGSFVSGSPEHMIQFEDVTELNKEEISIFINLDYPAYVSVEKAMKYCKSLVSMVNKLNTKFNVAIYGINPTDISNKGVGKALTVIKIKDSNHRMVLNTIAFSFHPSFFRRIWFKWIETKYFIPYGYGSPMHISSEKSVKEIVEVFSKEHNLRSPIVFKSLDFLIDSCHNDINEYIKKSYGTEKIIKELCIK